MKTTVLRKDKRYNVKADRNLNIQAYGEGNDYPQQVMEIVEASGTGKACVGIYAKFVSGKGFTDEAFYRMAINEDGHTNDFLEDQIAKDLAMFGGFAVHVNYNANYQIISLSHIPFEHVRFEKPNDAGEFSRVAIHPDWGKRFTDLRKFKKEDIDFINLFDPDPSIIRDEVMLAGSWENYKGQVYYYSNNGPKTYPTPIYDAILTDMNTEEGIMNVSNRNARSNFLTAGAFIDKRTKTETEDGENDVKNALLAYQGDEEACSIMYMSIDTEEEKPEFIPFSGENYDKEFTVTRESVQSNIGKAFNQPPILRAEDVGDNFGANAIKNAYGYYNSVTSNERLIIERAFAELFRNYKEATSGNYELLPLSYEVRNTDLSTIPPEVIATMTDNEKRALVGLPELEKPSSDQQLMAEKIGVGGVQGMIQIVTDVTLNSEQKKNMLKLLFNLTDENAASITGQ